MELSDDIVFEVILHMDAVSICRFLSVSKRFWNQRTKKNIIDRIDPYKKYIVYGQWNKGLIESVKRNKFPQIVFFIEKGADDVHSAIIAASSIGDRSLLDYFLKLNAHNMSIAPYNAEKYCMNATWHCRNAAIEEAAKGGHKHLVEFWFEKIGETPDFLAYAFKGAVSGGQTELMNYVLTKENLNWNEIAMFAARGGQKHIVEMCIKKGAFWGEAGQGAAWGGHKDLLEYCWEKSVLDFDAEEIAMAYAVEFEYKEMVNWLIERKKQFRIWRVDHLFAAATGGHMDMIELVMKHLQPLAPMK